MSCCRGPGQWDDGVPSGQGPIDAAIAALQAGLADEAATRAADDATLAAAIAAEAATRAADDATLQTSIDDLAATTARVGFSLFRFDQMATVVLANGPTTLVDTDGNALPITVGNVGAAATFRILNGTGLEFVANATNTVYNSGAQSASFLEAAFADIFATYGVDASYDYQVRIHCTVQTFPSINVTGALTLCVRGVTGAPSNGTARMRGLLRSNQGGVQVMRHGTDAGGGQNYVLPTVPSLPNTFGIRHEQGAMASGAGRWAGTFDDTQMLYDVGDQPATTANTSGYRDSGNILGLGFGTGNALADVRVTIDQMRIDWRATA